AAGKPVGMIPNCAATRHAHFQLDGSGVAHIQAPKLEDYPSVTWDSSQSKRVNLDTITQEEMDSWKPGDTLLLSGTMYTGRDAAHKRMVEMIDNGEELPVDLKGKFIYYVG
ncbi:fumarate hydratase C-terminal domain-containing protein, partial [Franconibacter daqui]